VVVVPFERENGLRHRSEAVVETHKVILGGAGRDTRGPRAVVVAVAVVAVVDPLGAAVKIGSLVDATGAAPRGAAVTLERSVMNF
jgi:hypothetical protein